jgi:carboxypeptidase C (cathepsin A)
VANVLYLDSPAGVGYSYSLDGQFADDDRKLLKENHAALQAFYDEFTEFRNSQLYIGGSGYGGLQAILLADEIMQNITKSGIKLQVPLFCHCDILCITFFFPTGSCCWQSFSR